MVVVLELLGVEDLLVGPSVGLELLVSVVTVVLEVPLVLEDEGVVVGVVDEDEVGDEYVNEGDFEALDDC